MARGHGVFEPLEHDERCALGRQEAVGVTVERSRLSRTTQRIERSKADVKEQIVRAINGASEHEVG